MAPLSLVASALRPACLRGICPGADPPHAVLSLAPRQFMVLPLSRSALDRWAPHVGQRVWVNPALGTLSLQAPDAATRVAP